MTLEQTIRTIIGGGNYRRDDFHISPSQYMHAVELLDQMDYRLVSAAVTRLESIVWLRRIGIDRAPWDITEEDLDALHEAQPWNWRKYSASTKRWRRIQDAVERGERVPEEAPPVEYEEMDLFGEFVEATA